LPWPLLLYSFKLTNCHLGSPKRNTPMIIDALSPDGPGCKKLETSKAIPFAGLYHRLSPPSSCSCSCIKSTNVDPFYVFQPKFGSRHQKDTL
jgi:hypothetical protein